MQFLRRIGFRLGHWVSQLNSFVSGSKRHPQTSSRVDYNTQRLASRVNNISDLAYLIHRNKQEGKNTTLLFLREPSTEYNTVSVAVIPPEVIVERGFTDEPVLWLTCPISFHINVYIDFQLKQTVMITRSVMMFDARLSDSRLGSFQKVCLSEDDIPPQILKEMI
jgi:hypothetical protein